jgi:alanine dehydrogenase
MDFGVPIERHRTEHRVGLTPRGARVLAVLGHRGFVESGAGAASRFPDADYREAGAEVVFRCEEVYRRGEVVVGVSAPTMEEIALTSEGQVLMAFWHLAVAPKARWRRCTAAVSRRSASKRSSAMMVNWPVLHERARRPDGHPHGGVPPAARAGRGILLGASAGVPPATVLAIKAHRWAGGSQVAVSGATSSSSTATSKLRQIDQLAAGGDDISDRWWSPGWCRSPTW